MDCARQDPRSATFPSGTYHHGIIGYTGILESDVTTR